MTPRPFAIHVPDAVLADLRARLQRVRWPDEPPEAGWRYGTSLAYMKELVAPSTRRSGRTTRASIGRGRSPTAGG